MKNTGLSSASALTITVGGPNASNFSVSPSCGASLAAGASCSIDVAFTSSSSGTKQASIQIASSSAAAQTLLLTGTVASPVFTVSPQSVVFGPIGTGNTGSSSITVQNSGIVSVTNLAASVSGPNANEFSWTTSCHATLAVNATCTLNVTFAPTAGGTHNASINITADAAAAQVVPLTASSTAPDFVFTPPTNASSTVVAGQVASFTLSISQSGAFSGQVSMSCGNLPPYASCDFSPATFTVGSTPTPVTLRTSTQQTVTHLSADNPHCDLDCQNCRRLLACF